MISFNITYINIQLQKTITNLRFKSVSDNSINSQISYIIIKCNNKLIENLLEKQSVNILTASTVLSNI